MGYEMLANNNADESYGAVVFDSVVEQNQA